MRGIGVPELLVGVAIAVCVVGSIWIPLYFRRTSPGRLGTGVILALFFGPFGQLYERGATLYVILILAVYVIADRLVPERSYHVPIAAAISAVVMYVRIQRSNTTGS